MFQRTRYTASVAENLTVGGEVVRVAATDPDTGENGQVLYRINRRQSDSADLFAIDEYSGLLTLNKVLDFESRELHELVVVARDRGQPPQETTAFITVRVTDVNDNHPAVSVVWAGTGGRAAVREDTAVGQRLADLTVKDPDEPGKRWELDLTLDGPGSELFSLERAGAGYRLVLAGALDRETQDSFRLELLGSPPLPATSPLNIRVTDVNDNAPEFERESYAVQLLESGEAGREVVQVRATDRDAGQNGAVSYRIEHSAATHSDWFHMEADSGRILTRAGVDCELEPEPRLVVVATDRGNPALSATATVTVAIQDINDNEPIFEESFYNSTLGEDEAAGRCFLRVAARDPDCGINSVVQYSLGRAAPPAGANTFTVRPATGELCLERQLDYETVNTYDLTVVATDKVSYPRIVFLLLNIFSPPLRIFQ